MARKTGKTGVTGTIAEDVSVDEQGALSYTKEAMTTYGLYTLEQRAIPDFRDGFKPVHRRVLWAAHQLGLHGHRKTLTKAARIVGDTMGKFHPHGDTSIYGSLVTLTLNRVPSIFGSGNYGTLVDDAAAMRYTEARLSAFSDTNFFDRRYLPVTDMCLNFDGKFEEPAVMASVLPNLLLQGSYGIATGGTCSIPSFEPEGVAELTKLALAGKKVTGKMCLKYLVPSPHEGGGAHFEGDEDLTDELLRFYETGRGSIYWIPDCEYDIPNRTAIMTGYAPMCAKGLAVILAKVVDDERVASISDESDIPPEGTVTGPRVKLVYHIKLKSSVAKADVEDALDEITELFETKQNLVFMVEERYVDEDRQPQAKIMNMTMPSFFREWARWRIDLEVNALKNDIKIVQEKLARQELLLMAVLNRELIIKALDMPDTEAYLAKQLKISYETADAITDLRIKQLKALEEQPIRKLIAEHKKTILGLKAELKVPHERCIATIETVMETIHDL